MKFKKKKKKEKPYWGRIPWHPYNLTEKVPRKSVGEKIPEIASICQRQAIRWISSDKMFIIEC